MQIFLPYADFRKSLRVLDNKRLGKQRVETYQIISAITRRPKLDGTIPVQSCGEIMYQHLSCI